jgi:hypothetical protein
MAELPAHLQTRVLEFPEYSQGVNRIVVRLADGREFSDVFVGWGVEIIRVEGFNELPFDPNQIIDVRKQ